MAKNINTIRSSEADMLSLELQKILFDKKMPLQCQWFSFILSESGLHTYSIFKSTELSVKLCTCHIPVLAQHYWTLEPSSTFFFFFFFCKHSSVATYTFSFYNLPQLLQILTEFCVTLYAFLGGSEHEEYDLWIQCSLSFCLLDLDVRSIIPQRI